jgi:hypothetical protein
MGSYLRHHHPREAGGLLLVTRQAAVVFGIGTTAEYVRKRCTPIACDVASRASLYDLDELSVRFPRRVA